ncbi:MAG: vitamin K epoxide reductase family protein [Candidatus Woesearchaeota archaeon]
MPKQSWKNLQKHKVKTIYWISLISAMFVNFLFAVFIESQKRAIENQTEIVANCFADVTAGGCGTVATSVYATTFGVSNPWYGIYFFSFLILVGLIELFHIKDNQKSFLFLLPIVRYIQTFGMILATVFALWLLYVQFGILGAVCTYCLWVDGITIVWTIAYFILRDTYLYA